MLSSATIIRQARWQVAALQVQTKLLRLRFALRAYNPAQPRIPAGNPGGGRWTDGDADDAEVISVDDKTNPKYKIDLEEEDTRGGHSVLKHVGKTDEEMLGRVLHSRTPYTFYTFGLRRNGSFDSIESANDLVSRTLEQHQSEVDSVASGQSRSAFIESNFGHRTGREAYTAGYLEPYVRNTYGVAVLILRDPNSSRGYRVHTAYPRNDGD